MAIIDFKATKCRHCYKCVRNCEVKAIMVKDGRAEIMPENCILCGRCLQICPQSAKTLVSDLSLVKGMVEAGENVQPGQPVFSLLRIETVNVKIAVPENEVATLGDQAAMIKVAALGGQCFEGKVTEKGIVANPISHTYEAKIRLENPSGALLPGMVCDVRLSGEESVPAIALPNNAVLIANDGGRFVWKIVDGEAKATPVRTGDLTEQGLFILEGLNEGDIVVIGGYQKISEGMRVRAL